METIRSGLLPIIGQKINHVKVAKLKKYDDQRQKILGLSGKTVDEIDRRGKFLVWYFDDGTVAALNHLGMTGVWYHYSQTRWQQLNQPFEEYKHWKIYFHLDDDSHLLFVNVRTFGRFEIYSPQEIEQHPAIRNLGPDILAEEFDIEEFVRRVHGKSSRRRTQEIGKCLLDYNIVSGCGNIYKSEALFLSNIHPMTPANKLSTEQLSILGESLSTVAHMALKFKGSTLMDYRHVDGYSGLMQNEFAVYDREGEPCVTCSTPIEKGKQGDRTSFWCPSCQNNIDYDN